MNHINTLQAVASPTLRAILDDRQPAAIRLRQMAAFADTAADTGLVLTAFDLRGLVFALHAVADQLGEPVAVERPARKWWRIWG